MKSRSTSRTLLIFAIVAVVAVVAVAAWQWLSPAPEPEQPAGKFDPRAFVAPPPGLDAPYLATDYEVVDGMLAMARVRPNDYVIDLGSGDGRILIAAARSHGARGLGVDIDDARIREARANAEAARVTHLVEFRNQDLFETPLGEADVVTLYLTREVNIRLRPRLLEQLRPGSRVVSHDYDMGDWRPDQRQRVGSATLHMWIVPARFAGTWTFTEAGGTATVELEQSFQELRGSATSGERTGRIEQGQVTGRRIRFIADLGQGRKEYRGWIQDDRINPIPRDAGWQAVRTD